MHVHTRFLTTVREFITRKQGQSAAFDTCLVRKAPSQEKNEITVRSRGLGGLCGPQALFFFWRFFVLTDIMTM